MHQPWIEKYRPKTINNIIGQEHITNCINNFLNNNHLPNLLFSGPQSTAKTTLAHCITNQIFKNGFHSVLELNASDDRGIDTVRELIYNFVNTKNFIDNIKIIILDEIDAMTYDAQLLLNNIIDNNITNCRFIFICNYINKIALSLQSRCLHIVFKNLTINYLSKCIDLLSINESFKTENNIKLIQLCNRDIRKIYNLLQMLKYYNESITNFYY
jgi:replication factor C subunit 3/5